MMDGVLGMRQGVHVFSSLDLQSGYHRVRIEDEDEDVLKDSLQVAQSLVRVQSPASQL